jgi:hypothetical protein
MTDWETVDTSHFFRPLPTPPQATVQNNKNNTWKIGKLWTTISSPHRSNTNIEKAKEAPLRRSL